MKIKEAVKVLELYLRIADAFYNSQKCAGVKFRKGRLKFRKDVKEAILTLIKLTKQKV